MTGFLLTAKQKLMLCINKRLYRCDRSRWKGWPWREILSSNLSGILQRNISTDRDMELFGAKCQCRAIPLDQNRDYLHGRHYHDLVFCRANGKQWIGRGSGQRGLIHYRVLSGICKLFWRDDLYIRLDDKDSDNHHK